MDSENNILLQKVRQLFNKAHVEESSCHELIKLCSTETDLLYKAYYASALMISAKYHLNPFKKVSLFNEGRSILEDVISENYANAEIHFLRYTIQLNTPAFLGYNRYIESDRTIIREYLFGTPDVSLKSHMSVFLKDTRDELIKFL